MLCWLAAWADPKNDADDQQLTALGREFLATLFRLHDRPLPAELSSVEVNRQYENIDVLIAVNDDIHICIEDKVGTTEHSDQLARYVNALVGKGTSADSILPVYIQTHEQGSYETVKKSGYKVLGREQLLDILSTYPEECGNAIVQDFRRHLEQLDAKVNAFRTAPISTWNWFAWQGFFCELQRLGIDGKWGHVANPRGGFWGFWWHGRRDGASNKYMQLEENRLVFKINVDEASNRRQVRDEWMSHLLRAAEDHGVDVIRPDRRRVGEAMTVALMGGDYRVTDSTGVLDMKATLAVLRSAEQVFKATSLVP